MAFVYCRNCNWHQDDFWTWKWNWKFWKCWTLGYNPISKLILAIQLYGKPKLIEYHDIDMDSRIRMTFSWVLLFREIKSIVKEAINMKWRTWKQFDNDPNPVCPKCGSRNIVID